MQKKDKNEFCKLYTISSKQIQKNNSVIYYKFDADITKTWC
jgi:hypothetical protein